MVEGVAHARDDVGLHVEDGPIVLEQARKARIPVGTQDFVESSEVAFLKAYLERFRGVDSSFLMINEVLLNPGLRARRDPATPGVRPHLFRKDVSCQTTEIHFQASDQLPSVFVLRAYHVSRSKSSFGRYIPFAHLFRNPKGVRKRAERGVTCVNRVAPRARHP